MIADRPTEAKLTVETAARCVSVLDRRETKHLTDIAEQRVWLPEAHDEPAAGWFALPQGL